MGTTWGTHACTHSRTLRNLLQTHNMSNSDKFDQDAAIVPDEQVPQQLEGVLNSSDNDEFTTDEGINAPEGENYESVRGNEISKGEFENDVRRCPQGEHPRLERALDAQPHQLCKGRRGGRP